MKGSLTQERLKELLDYNPDTGVFTWKVNRRGHAIAGLQAGSIWWARNKYGSEPSDDHKYIMIGLDGGNYFAHRLALLYVKGYMPKEVDHQDNHGLHNWIDNLRECTKSQNRCNTGKYKNNTSGYKGVSRLGNKWRSEIVLNKKSYTKSSFETPELAHQWYCEMAHKLHGEFART